VTDEATPRPVGEIDWKRVFPDSDHRWMMGLRQGELPECFGPRDPSGQVLAERAQWLSAEPAKYAAMLPAAECALAETVALARRLALDVPVLGDPWEQLLALGRAWESDFVWMHPDETGTHRVMGGVVCFPSSWALGEKIGRTMSETHRPVPGLNSALDRQIETFFARMEPGVVWTRENVSYTRHDDLNQHPSRGLAPLDANVAIDDLLVRIEHQTLLKLLESGSILFGIRIENVPMRTIRDLPDVARRLARLLTTMSPDAAQYKGLVTARERIASILLAHGIAARREKDVQPDAVHDL
jgi:hypothetical protein